MVVMVACGGGNDVPDAALPDVAPAPGRFSASWNIFAGGVQIGCDDLDTAFIGVEIVAKDALIGISDTFGCSAGTAISDALEPGLYRIKFALFDRGAVVAEVPEFTDIELKRGQTTELAPMDFEIDATGQLALHVSTGGSTNCGVSGVGLESLTFNFEHGGACQALSANVTAGANDPAFAFAQVCPDPVATTCIELDQAMQFASVPSGQLHVTIDGFNGGNRCWFGDATVNVPTSGSLHSETLFLVPTSAPGCP